MLKKQKALKFKPMTFSDLKPHPDYYKPLEGEDKKEYEILIKTLGIWKK